MQYELREVSKSDDSAGCSPGERKPPGPFSRRGLSHMIWKPIPGFLDYEVSEHGDVRRGPKRLTPERTRGNGRKRFALSKGGRLFRFKAHQLVALAFIGPPPFEGAEVCHRDGFHHNNHYSNLRWGSGASNANEAAKHRIEQRAPKNIPLSRSDSLSLDAARFLESKL